MSTPTPAAMPNRRPHEAIIADALAELDGVDEVPLPEAIERLTATSEVLSRVLDASADMVQTSIPGIRQR